MENPSKSEVIGRCGGDEKKRMTTQNRQKSNAKNKYEKMFTCKGIIMTNNMIGFLDFFYRNLNVCNTRHVSPFTKAYIKVVRVVFFIKSLKPMS